MSIESSKFSINSENLKQFFESQLSEAVGRTHISVSPMALDYVSSVMTQFQETARLFMQQGVRLPVLSDMLSEALEADLYRRVTLLRQLGDTSLMVGGFFPEALSRRSLNLSYYQEMGGIAYFHLSELTESQNVFDELSASFAKLTKLVTEVSTNLKVDHLSVNELLEFYASSKSEAALQKLKEAGVVPLSSPKSEA